MLDLGFEREMNECLALIKKRCPDKFTKEPNVYYSDKIKVNFISATLSSKVQALGAKLMKDFKQVGFSSQNPRMESINAEKKSTEVNTGNSEEKNEVMFKEGVDDDATNIIESIPKQVK